MDKNQINNLIKIGLTKGEAKVYIALSELGSSTVGPIIKKSQVADSNIYSILNRLIDKGIVSFILKNKIKYFQAAPPINLLEYLGKKQEEIFSQKEILNEIIPEIENIQKMKPEQKAEIFLGEKGLRTAYERLLKGITKKDENLFFYIHEEEYEEESDLFYSGIQELAKRATLKGICNKKYKKTEFAKRAKHMELKFVDFPIPGNIDIVKDKVLIVSWKSPIISILINSKNIADNLKDYFNETWKIAKP
ncbi:MAG: helix-turn-helix domain-containing protein [Nanoarchaeota archaeon]|nr:helix-turn-helix domain-containing protein [Nanoarchaeota archaeon]